MIHDSSLQEVPAILKSFPNWVTWKLELNGDGKETKVPYTPGTERHASSTDPSTWTDFETAVRNAPVLSGSGGLGFVIHGEAAEAGIVGFDLDGCRNPETEEIAPWAESIVECLDSYTEYTPSQKGLRVWVMGTLPGKERVFNLAHNAGFGDKVKIEVYDSSRYYTVTGIAFYEDPCPIEKRDLTHAYELCRAIKAKYPVELKTSESDSNKHDASSVQIKSADGSITTKLHLLMNGTISSRSPFVVEDERGNSIEYPSQSEADQALCNLLAIEYKDAAKIDEQFRQSPLYREKWERDDYRERTVKRALESTIQETLVISQPEVVKPSQNPIPLWDRATPFCDIEDTPMEFIIPGLIVKGETTMMTGDFGSFKSYMSYFFADAISEGGMFVRCPAQKHPVLVLDRENSKATISLRRYLVGSLREKTNVRLLGRFTTPNAPEVTDAELLELCRTVHPFVVIDSMQDFHPGKKENDTDDMTQFSQEVNGLIDAGAVGVLIIHHVPKTGKGKGAMYRGATAIPGGVGGALFVEKVGRLGVKIGGFKTRDGEDSLIELALQFPTEEEIKNKSGRVTYSVVRAGLDKTSQLLANVVDFIREANQRGEVPSANEVSKELGGDRNENYAAVKRLTTEGKIIPDSSRRGGLKAV